MVTQSKTKILKKKFDNIFGTEQIKESLICDLPYKYFSNSGTCDNLYSIIGKAPRTKQELANFCYFFMEGPITAIHNNNKDCKEHALIIDAMWDSYSENEDFSIWYAARGTGKTYDLSFLAFLETIYKKKCMTTILGGSLEQAMRAVAYFNEFMDNDYIVNDYLINKEITSKGFKTINGSWVKALAASPKSIRGEHPNKLRIDEADELHPKLYQAALGQPKAKNGHKDNIIISSTLHNPFGLMSQILDDVEKVGGKLYKWCIMDVIEPFGFWTKEEVERKKRQVTKEMWDSEYLCKRPKIGDAIFDFEHISKAYSRRQLFDSNWPCFGGIDWGYTCTVLHLIQDYQEYINIPKSFAWEYYELTKRCDEIAKICKDKNVLQIFCDSNPKDNYVTLRNRMKKAGCKTKVIPIAFSVWKNIGINVIRFLLEKNLINISDKILKDKMQKYHYKDAEKEIIDKIDDHYPDALIAYAAIKWKMLGHLDKSEIKKMEEKEKKLFINVGTY